MCGIFAVINDQSACAAQMTLESLKRLEYRGYDSWGIAIVNNNQHIQLEKHPGKIGEAETTLPSSSISLGHTRWATHGGVTEKNAHPHTDCAQTIAVVHNGIVENYQQLKTELQKKGHQFQSETDTEAIAHQIEEHQKKMNFREAVFQTFSELEGANAIVVLDSTTQTLIACKNSSPLLLGLDHQRYFLGSDAVAFLPYTNQTYIFDDHEAVELTKNGYTIFDLKTEKEKHVSLITLDIQAESLSKGSFPHYFLKEIHEQPKIIERLVEHPPQQLTQIQLMIKKAKHVVIIGCGSAYHCGLIGSYLFAKQGISTHVYQAHEFAQFASLYGKESVVLAISQSGETIDTLLAAKQAKTLGAQLIGVINARGSSLERVADNCLPVGAGPEIAVVSSKAFTAQVSMLALLSGLEDKKIWEVLLSGMKFLFLERSLQSIKNLTLQLAPAEHLYIIGKDLNYPAALEMALKLKETSYLHAEAFAAGELKHGVLSLVTEGTPCLAVMSKDIFSKDTLSNATEISARGGKIIGLSSENNSIFSQHIDVPEAGQLSFLLNIVVSQLLAYYLGLHRGADPDKPRNLAKSVTVK